MNKIGFMQGRLSPLVNKQIQAFPFMQWREEFHLAQKLGLSCMEWTLDYPNLLNNPLLLEEYREEILQLSTSNNLPIHSITLDCCMQRPFWKVAEKKLFQNLVSDFESIISSASAIGAQILVLPLVDNGSINNKEQFILLKDILVSLYDFLKIKDVKIAFESDYESNKLSDFIKEFDKDLIGINYDIGNSASLGYDPIEEFKNYGDRVINIHIKDRLLGGRTVRLGKGDANFEKVFNALDSIKYEGNLILQTARSKRNRHYEELKMNLLFVKNYLLNNSLNHCDS